jgi:molybdopterin converting factor subunit 1
MYKVLFFGISRDLAGCTHTSFEGPESQDLGRFRSDLIAKYPALSDLESVKFAVNNEYQTDEFALSPGDEIAIIPPVSGG